MCPICLTLKRSSRVNTGELSPVLQVDDLVGNHVQVWILRVNESSKERNHMEISFAGWSALGYNGSDNASGAQTERRGGAGPVGGLLGGKDPTGRFCQFSILRSSFLIPDWCSRNFDGARAQ